jgi:hypothetical protein
MYSTNPSVQTNKVIKPKTDKHSNFRDTTGKNPTYCRHNSKFIPFKTNPPQQILYSPNSKQNKQQNMLANRRRPPLSTHAALLPTRLLLGWRHFVQRFATQGRGCTGGVPSSNKNASNPRRSRNVFQARPKPNPYIVPEQRQQTVKSGQKNHTFVRNFPTNPWTPIF